MGLLESKRDGLRSLLLEEACKLVTKGKCKMG